MSEMDMFYHLADTMIVNFERGISRNRPDGRYELRDPADPLGLRKPQ